MDEYTYAHLLVLPDPYDITGLSVLRGHTTTKEILFFQILVNSNDGTKYT